MAVLRCRLDRAAVHIRRIAGSACLCHAVSQRGAGSEPCPACRRDRLSRQAGLSALRPRGDQASGSSRPERADGQLPKHMGSRSRRWKIMVGAPGMPQVRFCQMAWITNEIDQAAALFRERHGTGEFFFIRNLEAQLAGDKIAWMNLAVAD